MAQSAKVKKGLEAARQAKVKGASTVEARATVGTWRAICDDPEASADLRALATRYRGELEGAIVNGDTAAEEAALSALNALTVTYA
jgi:hypothetical protein